MSQDFALRVADPNPLGIGDFVPTSDELSHAAGFDAESNKGGFLYGLGLQAAYDSNFYLTEDDEEDELSMHFQPWFTYTTDPEGGALFSLTANYRPSYNVYLNNSEFNGLDHTADLSLFWNGGLTQVAAFASYQELSGTDRLSGTFSSGSVISGGLRAVRQIAPRTSLNGALAYSQSDYETGNQQGTQALSGSIGALWAATERTAIGASIRYTQTESDYTGTRDAWGLLAEVRYKAGERIWLSASLGPEFTRDSLTDENDVGMMADISARYDITERWSWVNSISTGTVASPSEAGYLVNNVNFSTELQHRLIRGVLVGGLSLNYSDYQSVDDTVAERDNEENLSMFLGYRRQLWSERVAFDANVRYRVNSGARDWSQWILSTGFNVTF